MKSNAGKRISQYEVASMFGDIYCGVASVAKCVNGFKSAGIYPLNSAIFTDEDFQPADNLLQPVASTSESGVARSTVASTTVASISESGAVSTTVASNTIASTSEYGEACATVAATVARLQSPALLNLERPALQSPLAHQVALLRQARNDVIQ